MIDAFDITSQLITASRAGGTTAAASAAALEAIGGERDLYAQLTSADGSLTLDANTNTPGVFEASYSGQATGSYRIIWDAKASETVVTNPTGLNHVDLTNGGLSQGIGMTIGADHDTSFTVLVYTDANDWSQATITVPADSGDSGAAIDNVLVPFSSFTIGAGSGANFSNVGAVELESTGGPSVQTEITQVGSLKPVQVPGPDFANVSEADLLIVKSASAGSVIAGDSLTYTLTASNLGPSDATGVTVSDSLPSGETYATTSSSLVSQAGGVVTVNVGNLNEGATATATFVVMVSPSYVLPTITNTATISGVQPDPNSANNTSSVTTQVTTESDLSISKVASASSVIAGDMLTYTLTASNLGPSDATDVTMTDALPAGETYVSTSSSLVSQASGLVTVNVGPLNEGATSTATFVVLVSPGYPPGTITNTASIFDNGVFCNNANAITVVTAEADLTIYKSALPIEGVAGSPLTYTLTASNPGPSDATNVTMTDALPAGVSYASTSSSGVSLAGGLVTVNVGPLNVGASATATFVVMVSPSYSLPTIQNTASVFDNGVFCNNAYATTLVTAEADLSIVKSASPNPVIAGDSLTYTLTASNPGPSDATGVMISDTLPAGETYASTGSSLVSQSNGTVTVNVGNLNVGAAATAAFVVIVAPNYPLSTIDNTASVSDNESDYATCFVVTKVTAQADLSIVKAASASSVKIGGLLTYTLTASNSGPSDATGVLITDTLPAGLTYDSSSQGSLASGTLTVNVGDLAPGVTDTVTIVVTVASGTGSITNTAKISGNDSPSDSSSVTTFIINVGPPPPTPPPLPWKWYAIV